MGRRPDTDHQHRDAQRVSSNRPASLEERLLEQPRRTAGIDLHRQPVRLGERDNDAYLVGYIDEHGCAWESLAERLVSTLGGRLFDALKLHPANPRRDQLIEQVCAEVPDELIGDVARKAGNMLAIHDLAHLLDL